MHIYNDASDFMGGIYVFEFADTDQASKFAETYSVCPIWPVVSLVSDERSVFVLAVELKAQQHGDFSRDANTLVRHPEYVGAIHVRFHRDDGLLETVWKPGLKTGTVARPPCGSDCSECPTYLNPCRGCPATTLFIP